MNEQNLASGSLGSAGSSECGYLRFLLFAGLRYEMKGYSLLHRSRRFLAYSLKSARNFSESLSLLKSSSLKYSTLLGPTRAYLKGKLSFFSSLTSGIIRYLCYCIICFSFSWRSLACSSSFLCLLSAILKIYYYY